MMFPGGRAKAGLDRRDWIAQSNSDRDQRIERGSLDGASALPAIIVTHEHLRDLTRRSLEALYRRNDPPRLFTRAGWICRIRHDERGRPRIEQLSEHALRGELERSANFRKLTREGEVPVIPPLYIVQDAATQPSWKLPPLEGLIQGPVLREDGSVVMDSGYDPRTQLYYVPSDDVRSIAIPEHPSEAEVRAALALVEEALGGFPFVDSSSQANAIALLLTPIVRPAIAGPVPLAIIDAPQRGTGKTLLAEVVATIATGRCNLTSTPNREEEWGKLLTATLAEGTPFVILDNVRGTLRSGALERVLTSTSISDRILGHSKLVEVPQRATWAATTNNASISGDLGRRCVWIRLDAKMARPWQGRQFEHPDLLQWVAEHRGELLGALLTLARAWWADGCPKADVPRLGKFEDWSSTVGGILAHVGVCGFLGNLEEMYERLDEEDGQWETLLRAWWDALGDQSLTVSQLVEGMFEESGLAEVPVSLRDFLPDKLAEAAGAVRDARTRSSFSKKLGKALRRYLGVRYGDDNLRLEKAEMDSHRKVNAWRVVRDAGFAEVAEVVRAIPESESTPDTIPETPPALPPLPKPRMADEEAIEERAAIMEFDGGLPRHEAEARARAAYDSNTKRPPEGGRW
jgi:hypothetical protein